MIVFNDKKTKINKNVLYLNICNNIINLKKKIENGGIPAKIKNKIFIINVTFFLLN